jgi:hypothetical protein
MNKEFDPLEHRLSHLRPAHLPAPARQRILHEMQHPVTGHGVIVWLLGHRAGFSAALAGAFSLAVVVGLHSPPRSTHPASHVDQPVFAASNALSPSLAFLEERLTAVSPIGANAVAALCSPSMLTNVQNGR